MNKIKKLVKKSRFLYLIYYYIMSFVINVIKLFVKTDNKLILFVSYGGRHYSDSPRYIYETMLKDTRYSDYKLVWAFVNPQNFDVVHKVKIDTLAYYKCALKARCWITNVMVERALKFSGKKTYYFFTTHGLLPKLTGYDLPKGSSFDTRAKLIYDCCIVQSEYEKKVAMTQLKLSEDKIKLYGLPKNDFLANYKVDDLIRIKKELSIPVDKKVILYAPTFREYSSSMEEQFDIDVQKWKEALGDNYVLLYRAHPVVSSSKKRTDGFFFDVTKYEKLEELMIVSDILISDYSGIIFDYAIMEKPIILFTYDYEKYIEHRGLYMDLRDELPYSSVEDELLVKIKDEYNYSQLINFKNKYSSVYGSGSINCLNDIFERIKEK